MNCIFCCVFNKDKYVDMFYLLLESILTYGNLSDDIIILVYTSTPFMNRIKTSHLFNENKIRFEINDTLNTIDKACKARLDLFNLAITNYNKILYLDTDIIVKNDINKVFDVCKEDILYVLEEGNLGTDFNDYYGRSLFGDDLGNYNDKTAFTSGILLFNNCEKIKDLFNKINQDIIRRPRNFSCYDQPYIVYNSFKYKLYNNKILKSLVVNNDHNIHSDKVIHHFPGCPGIYQHKIDYMTIFLNDLLNNTEIYDVKIPPKKQTSFSLIGLCVSYNYFDTLQFMLPVNYLHFEKMYIITSKDDIQTIEFCKNFNNVIVLFFTFKHDNYIFDKYGGLKYAQEIAYIEYPDSWYLIIDSDIILPNNLIDILNREKLNSECIYGALRYNLNNSSELLNKKQIINNINNINWIYNNILYKINTPPSILGCFQLYKKHVYQDKYDTFYNFGDYRFGYDNFKIFCNIQNIIYFHLGAVGVNWNGKVISFIDDINIQIKNIYYNYNQKHNFIYYNEKCEIVNINENNIINNLVYKTYTWEKFYIQFLDNYKMDAFGEGHYKFIDNKNIIATFGGRIHNIEFNEDFTGFKSIRKDDFCIVKGNIRNIDSLPLTIEDDIWTCSSQMICDISNYFKDKSHFKIAEIGSYKGYSTKVLSKIFSKIYAIDNNFELTKFNKNFNKNATNIEYIMLDIYKDSWAILPDDIDVSFIDANHSYKCCKSDIFNSIKQFKNLKYIIFDDYGVWSGVKQIIDELIDCKILQFERFIGLNSVPGPNGIVKNINEGVICSVNKIDENINKIDEIINKKYTWENSYIKFLDNYKMDAFGEGYYNFIDKQNIIANFGGRIHNIQFNDYYTTFTSTRKDDLQIVNGTLEKV